MIVGQVRRALAARNGGPGITTGELSQQLEQPEPLVRQAVAHLVLSERIATCDGEGKYRLGDPTALLRMGG
jgi:DNA-binding IclR family transcriptional regulator